MIRLSQDEHAYRITLDEPPLHILHIPMLEELREALRQVGNDRHALIIEATGEKVFSAGVAVQDHLGGRAAAMLAHFHEAIRILHRLELVTVALVKGLALGGGCELVLACDFVLASDAARFGLPEIHLGVFPPVAAYQLSRQLPPRKGLELLLTGDPIDAATAAHLGLINAVFPLPDFDAHAASWLSRLYALSPSSLRIAKRAFRAARHDDLDERLGVTERIYLHELMETEDAIEGLEAFLEKRRPQWKGR